MKVHVKWNGMTKKHLVDTYKISKFDYKMFTQMGYWFRSNVSNQIFVYKLGSWDFQKMFTKGFNEKMTNKSIFFCYFVANKFRSNKSNTINILFKNKWKKVKNFNCKNWKCALKLKEGFKKWSLSTTKSFWKKWKRCICESTHRGY